MAWLSADPGKAWAERLFLQYSPVWMLMCGVVVACGIYELFSGFGYVLFGAAIAVPCVGLPWALDPDTATPLADKYWVKVNVWVAITAFVGNYFVTHYFYQILGVSYSVPTAGGWLELNGVPVVMYLMTQPYFLSYHVGSSVLLRRLGFWAPSFGVPRRCLTILAMALATAFMETWSISAFPHYTYPDQWLMLTVGSGFYCLYFLVTYPAFSLIEEGANSKLGLAVVAAHALACNMLVLLLMDFWRLVLGRVMEPGPALASLADRVPFVG